MKWLTRLCNQVLKDIRIKRDWTLVEIVSLHKKGDLTDKANYRQISLLTQAYKVLTRTVQSRISKREEEMRSRRVLEQGEERTSDRVFLLSEFVERKWEKGKDTS